MVVIGIIDPWEHCMKQQRGWAHDLQIFEQHARRLLIEDRW